MSVDLQESGARAAWEAFRDHPDRTRAATGREYLRHPQPATESDLPYRDLPERRDIARLPGRENPLEAVSPPARNWPGA